MSDDELIDLAHRVRTKKDFLSFMLELQKNYGVQDGTWENDNLRAYLEGFHGYAVDTVDITILSNEGHELLSWQRLAEMMLAARVYE
ncbi:MULTISPECIES: hypothetical protein [Thalassospira]|uniref:DUF7660 family protein n=1 Tax=Thalassospira TaxID=168934 RepID=UPI001ADB0C0A|nr:MULTISPECIES: hypothetical protein [Thalassospira]MBO9507713.1 hypothetical protein [Thalassospira sp. A3_1]WOI09248.1 hypothetical protein R1T41_11980 [Thalassospira lucentensis]